MRKCDFDSDRRHTEANDPALIKPFVPESKKSVEKFRPDWESMAVLPESTQSSEMATTSSYKDNQLHRHQQQQQEQHHHHETLSTTIDAPNAPTSAAAFSPPLCVPLGKQPQQPRQQQSLIQQINNTGNSKNNKEQVDVLPLKETTSVAMVTTANRLQSTSAPKRLQARGFLKWGIPLPCTTTKPFQPCQEVEYIEGECQKPEYMLQMETILMERLIWVRYRHDRYWWPAILYKKGYKELIHHANHVWNYQVTFWKRLDLVYLTVFDSANQRNQVPVARVLGRPGCELIELPMMLNTNSSDYNISPGKPQPYSSTADFFWELPKILPVAACNIEFFAQDGDYDLYYDWHRALDQVECLLYDCLGKHMPLSPTPSGPLLNEEPSKEEFNSRKHRRNKLNTMSSPYLSHTWVQRARHAERIQWEEHKKYVGCLLFLCGPDDAGRFKEQP